MARTVDPKDACPDCDCCTAALCRRAAEYRFPCWALFDVGSDPTTVASCPCATPPNTAPQVDAAAADAALVVHVYDQVMARIAEMFPGVPLAWRETWLKRVQWYRDHDGDMTGAPEFPDEQ